MENFNVKDNIQIYQNKNPYFMPGAILSSMASSTPEGWLNCNGQEVLISQYQELYDSIGTTYNLGTETSGNFRLPNISSKYLIQKTSGSGIYGASSSHTHSTSANYNLADKSVSHSHPTNNYSNGSNIEHGGSGSGGGGGTDNNPLNANKTGFSSGGASGAGHYHSVNSGGNQAGPYGNGHGHDMDTRIQDSSQVHGHTGSFTATTSTASVFNPPSFVINYFIKY